MNDLIWSLQRITDDTVVIVLGFNSHGCQPTYSENAICKNRWLLKWCVVFFIVYQLFFTYSLLHAAVETFAQLLSDFRETGLKRGFDMISAVHAGRM